MLAPAYLKQDLPLGSYYSPPDMRRPGFRDTSRPLRGGAVRASG